jgi:hypothetical protein
VLVRFSSNVLGALRDSLLIGGLILGFLLTTTWIVLLGFALFRAVLLPLA